MSSRDGGTVPTWDGHPKGWRRYCREVVWFVQSTKVTQRRHIATRLIARLTGSARLLAMSWTQAEFDDDRGVLVYLQKLAKSPLVRRSLPNAAATMSQYLGFRRLPQETIASFLVRETLSYEEFQEALIRLREERSGVDPAQQDFGSGEVFRRSDDEWWNQQQRWRQWERQDGPENDDAPRPSSPGENDDAAPKTFSPARSAAGSPPPRREHSAAQDCVEEG